MVPGQERKGALVRAWLDVMGGAGVDALREILAEDCVDHHPIPGQPSGRIGAIWKVLVFRAHHPDARVEAESIEATEGGARATWTTTARGLNGAEGEATFRFTGVFEVDESGERLRSLRIEAMHRA